MELLADNVNRTTYDFNVRVASKAGLEESECLKLYLINCTCIGSFDDNEKDSEIVLKTNQLTADTVCIVHYCLIYILDIGSSSKHVSPS